MVFGDSRRDARPARRHPVDSAAVREGRLRSRDEVVREVEALDDSSATLNVAVLRLGSTLALATLPRPAADSARPLTSAR